MPGPGLALAAAYSRQRRPSVAPKPTFPDLNAPPFAEAAPGPAPEAPTQAPAWPPPEKPKSSDYGDILDAAVAKHEAERPGTPFTYGEVSATAREVRKRLPAGEQFRMAARTGRSTTERTGEEIAALRKMTASDRAHRETIAAELDERRITAGFEPVSRFFTPEMKSQALPLVQLAAIARQRAEQARQEREKVAQRARWGISVEKGYAPEDIDAWDKGLLGEDPMKIRLKPPQMQEMDYGGRKFVKPPAGYTELKPEPATPMDPRERLQLTARYGERTAIRTQRLSLGDDIAKLSGALAAAKAELDAQRELLKGAKHIDRDSITAKIAELQGKYNAADVNMRHLVKRDQALGQRESELVQSLGGASEPMTGQYIQGKGGVRQVAPLAEDLWMHQMAGEFKQLEEIGEYIQSLIGAGLSPDQIMNLLEQHPELSEEDLQLAAEAMAMPPEDLQ